MLEVVIDLTVLFPSEAQRSPRRPPFLVINPADNILVTAPCDVDDFCYANTILLQDYLNLDTTFTALSIPKEVKNFTAGSMAVENAFMLTNDWGISTVPQVQYLLANQIDVLIYQGNLDLACNTAGAKRWTANMQWKGQSAFTALELKPWKSSKDGKEVVAGKFKEVNIKMVEGDGKTTRFALVTIDGSGHMVGCSISIETVNDY